MRIVNRFWAMALAIALLIVAAILISETIAALLDASPLIFLDRVEPWLRERQWSDAITGVVGASCLAAGVLLVLLEVWPKRPTGYEASSPGSERGGQRRVRFARRGLERHLESVVERQADMVDVRAKGRRRSMRLHVGVPAGGPTSSEPVRSAVRAELDALELQQPTKVKTKVRRTKERVT